MNQEEEFEGDFMDGSLEQYKDYEHYLDDHMLESDLYYLEDKELVRQLIELGYHGKGEILTREQFQTRKQSMEEAMRNKNANQAKSLAQAGCKFDDSPFLTALAEREERVRNGRLTTIIFIREKRKDKAEISGYIDLAHRMKTEDFKQYFERKKILSPKPTDLSFYNWDTQYCNSADSLNFRVDADSKNGLMFRNKRDRKVINVDPKKPPGDNTRRIELKTDQYIQVVFFDHQTRRKN